jgi:DNA-binding transcriptional regulator GbsR (MarR family)
MKYKEAKNTFINAWGVLGSDWGISRTMAQIHALLLISKEALTTEEIMEDLQISRGNANMNLRALSDWNLVFKIVKPGERKEYFSAEKDIRKVALHILRERKKRELDPVIQLLKQLEDLEDSNSSDAKEMKKVLKDIQALSTKADQLSVFLNKSDQSKVWSTLLKMI